MYRRRHSGLFRAAAFGALLELERHFSFDVFVGTSAGAITAMLLASDYSPGELKTVLMGKDFLDFLDASIVRVPLNLLLRCGCYPGEHFRQWMDGLLRAQIKKFGEIKLSDLPNDAVIYACSPGSGTVVFDSRKIRADAAAAFATRCSMSIPLFFFPTEIDGRRVYDGGLRQNFPVARFLADNPRRPLIALYIGSPLAPNLRRWIGWELFDIWVGGEELSVVDSHSDSVVVIDTSPIGTLSFNLDAPAKDFLLKVGREAALRFLHNRNLDDGPSQDNAWTKWRRLISEQGRGGQSVAAFCREQELSASHFYWWKKRLWENRPMYLNLISCCSQKAV